ncbi:unnamed protein product, partial [Rotaria sp. Silwood1]
SLLNELSCPLPANVDGSVMYLLILYPPIKHSQSGEHLSEQYYSAKSSPSCTHTNILKRRDNGINTRFVQKKTNRLTSISVICLFQHKIIVVYAKRQGFGVATLRLVFNGKRINDDEISKQLEIEDNDIN